MIEVHVIGFVVVVEHIQVPHHQHKGRGQRQHVVIEFERTRPSGGPAKGDLDFLDLVTLLAQTLLAPGQRTGEQVNQDEEP